MSIIKSAYFIENEDKFFIAIGQRSTDMQTIDKNPVKLLLVFCLTVTNGTLLRSIIPRIECLKHFLIYQAWKV